MKRGNPDISEHGFKKGESGNPNGRPKGTRNRSTIVREWLECSESVTNPITGEKETLQQSDIITLALIKKARKGDVNAFRELMDSGFGRTVQEIVTSQNIKLLNIDPLDDSADNISPQDSGTSQED